MSKAAQNYNGCASNDHYFIRSGDKILCRKCDEIIAANPQAILKKIVKKEVIDYLRMIEHKIFTIAFRKTMQYANTMTNAQLQNYAASYIYSMTLIIDQWIQENVPLISDQNDTDFDKDIERINSALSNIGLFMNHPKNGVLIGKLLSLHIKLTNSILADYSTKNDMSKAQKPTLKDCISLYFIIQILKLDIKLNDEALGNITGALKTLGISNMREKYEPNIQSLDQLYQYLNGIDGLKTLKSVLKSWEFTLELLKEDINGDEDLKEEIPSQLYGQIKRLLVNVNKKHNKLNGDTVSDGVVSIINLYERLLEKSKRKLGIDVVVIDSEVKEDLSDQSEDVNVFSDTLSQVKQTQNINVIDGSVADDKTDQQIVKKNIKRKQVKTSKYVYNNLNSYLKVYKRKLCRIREQLTTVDTLKETIKTSDYAEMDKKGWKRGTKSRNWRISRDKFVDELLENVDEEERIIEEVAETDEHGHHCIKTVWVVKVNFKGTLYDIGVEVEDKSDGLKFTALHLKLKGRESEWKVMDNLWISKKSKKMDSKSNNNNHSCKTNPRNKLSNTLPGTVSNGNKNKNASEMQSPTHSNRNQQKWIGNSLSKSVTTPKKAIKGNSSNSFDNCLSDKNLSTTNASSKSPNNGNKKTITNVQTKASQIPSKHKNENKEKLITNPPNKLLNTLSGSVSNRNKNKNASPIQSPKHSNRNKKKITTPQKTINSKDNSSNSFNNCLNNKHSSTTNTSSKSVNSENKKEISKSQMPSSKHKNENKEKLITNFLLQLTPPEIENECLKIHRQMAMELIDEHKKQWKTLNEEQKTQSETLKSRQRNQLESLNDKALSLWERLQNELCTGLYSTTQLKKFGFVIEDTENILMYRT